MPPPLFDAQELRQSIYQCRRPLAEPAKISWSAIAVGAISSIGLTRPSTTHRTSYTTISYRTIMALVSIPSTVSGSSCRTRLAPNGVFLICIISTSARDKLLMAHQERPIVYCLDLTSRTLLEAIHVFFQEHF